LKDYRGLVVTCPTKEHEDFGNRVKVFHRDASPQTLDLKPDFLGWYNNTGATAVGLALRLGARRVVLLGFDMKWAEGDPGHNFHENEKSPICKPAVMLRHFEGFKLLKKHVDFGRYRNHHIVNAGPDSDLYIFEDTNLEDEL